MKNALKWLAPVVIVVASFAAAALLVKTRKPAKPTPREAVISTVRAITAAREPHRFMVASQGTVTPATDIRLSAEVAGRVVRSAPAFTEGEVFRKGETLVEIDARDFELALTRAKADLARAQVVLQREEAESQVAREEWKRIGRGEANPLVLREPQLADARALVAAATAVVEQAQRDMDRCQIRAPFDGRVWEKLVDVGQYVQKGAALARIYGTAYAEVRLPIAIDQLAYVELPIAGSAASENKAHPAVTLSASIGGRTETWQGVIARTEAEINNRTRMLHAIARVEEPYNTERLGAKYPLAVGMFVNAEIAGNQAPAVVRLPRSAIRGTNQCLVIADGRLTFRTLQILRADDRMVIVGDGLKNGEQVCVSPLDAVVEGMRVRVASESGASTSATNSPAPRAAPHKETR